MKAFHVVILLACLLALTRPADAVERRPVCPPTPGVAPADDIERGRCLFHSKTAFGQDPGGPFASCALCHYGSDKTDHGAHLIQITNEAGRTIQVLRKTPSLLKAAVNFPYGADGRFPTVQEAARAAILSPVEMSGAAVSRDQLDALAAFVLGLPGSEQQHQTPAPPSAPDAGTLERIALGKTIFFGKGTCFTCHAGSEFTNHAITANQVHFNFTGRIDPGAGFVGTGDRGTFKVPSLLFLAIGKPFMHNGALPRLAQVLRFYNESLGLNLTGREMTGLDYWLRNCLDPRKAPKPETC
jgi:Di-haem cytochrome c peroxidase